MKKTCLKCKNSKGYSGDAEPEDGTCPEYVHIVDMISTRDKFKFPATAFRELVAVIGGACGEYE